MGDSVGVGSEGAAAARRALLVGRAERIAAGLAAGPPAISADGRYVAFVSESGELVPGDANEAADVFVRDTVENRTVLVSRSVHGGSGSGCSLQPSISADGQVVAFTSAACDLVPGDTNGTLDVFVHDLRTGRIDLVSRGADGALAERDSFSPSLSADGRFVAFCSLADLDPNDRNAAADVYLHDRVTGSITLISAAPSGQAGNGPSGQPSVSADGGTVAFTSAASDLARDDHNGAADVFVRDTGAGVTQLVSRGTSGAAAAGSSTEPVVSADGRRVAFTSDAADLVDADDNDRDDVFVHDVDTRSTRMVSVTPTGNSANGSSGRPAISADGSRVAFVSDASDLVEGEGTAAAAGSRGYLRDLTSEETAAVGDAADRGPEVTTGIAVNGAGDRVAFRDGAAEPSVADPDAGPDAEGDIFLAPVTAPPPEPPHA